MISKIDIFELDESISLSYKDGDKYNAWISVVDEEDRYRVRRMKNNYYSANRGFKLFSQFFYDWSDEDQSAFILRNIETMGPSKQNIQNIISFIRDELVNSEKTYNLGINCFAGISRSSAVAIIAWVLSGKNPQEALEEVLNVRPQAWPNLRILRFADEILQTSMHLLVKTWKEKNNGFYNPQGGWHW